MVMMLVTMVTVVIVMVAMPRAHSVPAAPTPSDWPITFHLITRTTLRSKSDYSYFQKEGKRRGECLQPASLEMGVRERFGRVGLIDETREGVWAAGRVGSQGAAVRARAQQQRARHSHRQPLHLPG